MVKFRTERRQEFEKNIVITEREKGRERERETHRHRQAGRQAAGFPSRARAWLLWRQITSLTKIWELEGELILKQTDVVF